MSEVDCPSCDSVFGTEHGMKIHHLQTHGVSLSQKKETICLNCGEEFTYHPADRRGEYCSKDCESEDKRVEVACKVCGTSFETPKSIRRETCGPECADVARSDALRGVNTGAGETIIANCDYCGSEVEKWKSQYDDYQHHFCDGGCLAAWKSENGVYPTTGGSYETDELDHIVRSGWEEGVALLLKENNIEYEYEYETFNLGDRSYTPDFFVGEDIIEVKGRPSRKAVENAERLLDQISNRRYIVVGTELPCDVHVGYDDRQELIEVIK